MNLSGKRVLVTGATGGIGKELVHLLDATGALVTAISRNIAPLETLIRSLAGSEHHILSADVSTIDGLSEITAYANRHPVDVVINNAGVNQFAFLTQRNTESIIQELDINLKAPILITHSALTWPYPPSLIVNIGSALGGIGLPGYSVYGASKAGLYRFSESINRELINRNTSVLFIGPRATKTAMNTESVTQMNKALGTKMDTPSWVANQVIKAIRNEKKVTWLGWPEKFFVRLNNIFPALVSRALRKQHAIVAQFADYL